MQIVGFDLKHRLILNRVTYPAMVVAVALSPVSPGLDLWRALAGGVGIGLFFLIQNVISRGGIGLGDAKLGALVGALCGLGLDLHHIGAAYAVIYAIFLGGAVRSPPARAAHPQPQGPHPVRAVPVRGGRFILFWGP